MLLSLPMLLFFVMSVTKARSWTAFQGCQSTSCPVVPYLFGR